MSGFTIEFKPWRPFLARKKDAAIRSWLEGIGSKSLAIFKAGMNGSSVPSAPGGWPGVRTGRLRGSMAAETTQTSVTIGTNMPYSIYLRTGTSKMARRKMSDNALKEGMQSARLVKWVEWSR